MLLPDEPAELRTIEFLGIGFRSMVLPDGRLVIKSGMLGNSLASEIASTIRTHGGDVEIFGWRVSYKPEQSSNGEVRFLAEGTPPSGVGNPEGKTRVQAKGDSACDAIEGLLLTISEEEAKLNEGLDILA